MNDQVDSIDRAAKLLKERLKTLDDKRAVLRAPELAALYDELKLLPAGKARAEFGQQVNALRSELEQLVKQSNQPETKLTPIDVTAPFDVNSAPGPGFLPAENASRHPITTEINRIIDIFGRMGFKTVESREIDDDYHMFTSLNFPPGHPAREDYDTFMTDEGLIAPAHTSTMQNRVMKAGKKDLTNGQPIAAIIPDRVFRNEDLDARHEHTFYQLEAVHFAIKKAAISAVIPAG
jgi:phenylalanyl-tRNA synthetase alpha chain